MAAPKKFALNREDLPDAPEWTEQLLAPLNLALGESTQALNRGLTFQDNFESELKEFTFVAPGPRWIDVLPATDPGNGAKFQNGWSNLLASTRPVGYRIHYGGRVETRGVATGGTIGLAIFTLPVGFRPDYQELFPADANSAHGRCQIGTGGEVLAAVGSNVYFSLSGIYFDAAAPCAFPAIPTGWPQTFSTTLPTVSDVQVVSCTCLENTGSGSSGWPQFEWERSDQGIKIKNVTGLVPGRKYTATLRLIAG